MLEASVLPGVVIAALLPWFFSQAAHAQQSPPPATQASAPLYKLPVRGAPASRVGGGTRGPAADAPNVTVLAPDHTGLTTNPQPTLYWHLSKQAPVQIELTLLDDAGVKPLIEKVVKAPLAAGFHAISLKDAGVTLAPDVEYRWHVALIFDPKMRSSDVTSSGTIQLVKPPQGLQAKLTREPTHVAYASEGLWYDSVEALMTAMERAPQNDELSQQLQGLLGQVGLTGVGGSR